MELVYGFLLGMCIGVPAELLLVVTLHLSDGAAVLSGFLVGTVATMASFAFLARVR